MTSDDKPVQVQIVDPAEVSQLIELESSKQPVNRDAGPRRVRIAGPRTVPLPVVDDRPMRARSATPGRPRGAERTEQAASDQRPHSGNNATADTDGEVDIFSGFEPAATASAPEPAASAPDVFGASREAASGAQDAGLLVREATEAHDRVVTRRSTFLNERLIARKLAVGLDAAIRESGCQTVLLTSPGKASGKTRFARVISPQFSVIAPDRYMILGVSDLAKLDPYQRPPGLVVIVDGPSMLDGDGLLGIPQHWMDAFDGAVLMVMGRQTRTDDLEQSVQWLDNARIKTIGIIFNEFISPEPSLRLKRWRRYLTGGTVVRDLLRVIRTGGRARRSDR